MILLEQTSLYDKKHALFMQQYIQTSRKNKFEVVCCEAPYCHYGQKGYVDLVLKKYDRPNRLCLWKLCELKPLLLDIGQTIRQINRTREYFFKDKKELLDSAFSNEIKYPLVVEANPHNLSVCLQYLSLLKNIHIEFFSADSNLAQQISNKFQIHKEIIKVQNRT